MFDIGWSELLVIGVVLIVVVGPKDLPKMLRTFGRATSQMRKMAGDFRKQFDEALREAELDEVRQTVKDVRSLDPTKDIRKAMNPIKAVGDEIRSSLKAATRAPEPKVPSADAPAAPAEPSVIGTAEMQPKPISSNPISSNPVASSPASSSPASSNPVVSMSASSLSAPEPIPEHSTETPPPAAKLNGSGAHANGKDAGGDRE